MNEHPLTSLLESYCKDFNVLKDQNQDLDNFRFQSRFGLSVTVPETWPLVDSVGKIVEYAGSMPYTGDIVIVYSSTKMYRSLLSTIKDGLPVVYFSWHEFYVAMDRVNKDARDLQRFKKALEKSPLTVFCGAPIQTMPEVVDQIRGFCEGCLIILN